jgi:hypothetical protein
VLFETVLHEKENFTVQDKGIAAVRALYAKVLTELMPAEAGDTKDWCLMILSTVVLVYFSACLFMLYDYAYRAAGFVTIAEYMAR